VIETVLTALKGTTFRPLPRFSPLESANDGVAAYFVMTMKKVLDKLAQDTDLNEYFDLLQKYPVYPADRYSDSLELDAKEEPHDLYSRDRTLEDYELQAWIPWWASKCVIGH
jgi:hypothetical protein